MYCIIYVMYPEFPPPSPPSQLKKNFVLWVYCSVDSILLKFMYFIKSTYQFAYNHLNYSVHQGLETLPYRSVQTGNASPKIMTIFQSLFLEKNN